MHGFLALRRLAARLSAVCLLLVGSAVHAETYWLDSRFDDNEAHYPTGEEACITGELQRRLDGYQASSTLQHRYVSPPVGPDNGTGERVCRSVAAQPGTSSRVIGHPAVLRRWTCRPKT